MQTEWKYVVDEFDKNFSDKATKRIVIYGIGKHTKAILDVLGNKYNIIGLMDAAKAGEMLWGYRIFDNTALAESGADFVVIVARPSVHQIIYRRIAQVVLKKNISVFSIEGQRITCIENKTDYDHPYFQKGKEELLRKIEKHDVISFDIFDTVIMRKVMYPQDVFYILEEELRDKLSFSFLEERMNAEQRARENGYPTIHEIYDELQAKCGLSNILKEKLKEEEIEKEKSLMIPRREMCEVLAECVRAGKRVVLVSDMYLTSEIIGEILKQCNVAGYAKLLVSCEYKRAKQEGLFQELLKETSAEKILHIGDNPKADIMAAEKYGIHTYRIWSALEMLEHSSYSCIMDYAQSLYSRNIIGLMISYVFNSPFALYRTKGIPLVDSVKLMGVYFASLMLLYVLWIIDAAGQYTVSDILFAARDGYIPRQIYNMLVERFGLGGMPEGKYIYTSGRASSVAAIYREEDILPLISEFKGGVKELFENVFSMTDYSIDEQQEMGKNVSENIQGILRQAREERNSFKQYLEEQDIDFSGKVLYFDIFSKGTGQDNLERILEKKLAGIYLNKTVSGIQRRNELAYESFFEASNHYEKDYNIFKAYSLVEYIFSSPEPCLKRFENSTPIFYEEDRSEEGLTFLKFIQACILEFCTEYIGMGKVGKTGKIDPMFGDALLGLLLDKSRLAEGLVPTLVTYEWFRGAYKVTGEYSMQEENAKSV